MRAAAHAAGALIVAGIYLAIAAAITLTTTAIVLGMLTIAAVASVSLVVATPAQEA
ncbi:MAG TPA: hypothetical protein VFN76_03230 [Candidatus Limnocylindria bacterium]|nr:hypothetical protein [Candidatus Limnocylindria bacterium]